MANWTNELEYHGYTRNEGCADDIISSYEKEFENGFVGFIDVYDDGTFAISALHNGDIELCEDERYDTASSAITYLEDEINKLQHAWE